VGVGLALLSMTPARAGGQEETARGGIRGTVVEADSDRPVRSATVLLVPVPTGSGQAAGDDGTPRTSYTDVHGRYAFTHVAAGRYRIEISGLGYRSARVWITLPRDWEVRRSVALDVDPVVLEPLEIRLPPAVPRVTPDLTPLDGPGVRVPGAAFAAGGPTMMGLDVRVLDPRRLPGVGPLGEPDVFRALQRLPGVSARGDFSDNVWTRGAPWGMTEILLDGLPLFDPLHLGGIAAGLAADGLESIALMPGVRPSSASEGAAGTIALTTRPAAAHRSGSVAVSSMAVRTRLEDRFLDGRVGMAVTARRSWWDLIAPPPIFTAESSRHDVDYRFADLAARLDARLGGIGVLEAGGLWEHDHLDGSIAGLVSSSEGRWGNRLGWVKLGHDIRGVHAEARIGTVDYRVATRPWPWSSFFGPDGIPSLDHIETHIAHSAADVRARGALVPDRVGWGAGVSFVRERLEQLGPDASDRGLPGVDDPAVLGRARAWAETTLDLGPVDVAGGFALDHVPAGSPRPPVLPSLQVRWEPSTWLTLEVADGGAVQFIYPLAPAGTSLGPSLGTGYTWIIAVGGTPPLVSHTSTASALLTLPHGVSATVTAWRRHVADLWLPGVSAIDAEARRRPVSDGWGHERGRGMELRVGWRNERASADASYSLERSRYADAEGLTWPSPAERRHSLDLHAMVHASDALSIGADYTAESGWPLLTGPAINCGDGELGCVDLPQGGQQPTEYTFSQAPRFASLDLKVEWRHAWKRVALGVTGSLRNVLGRENAAAYRAGTCDGAELVSAVCEQARGLARFSAGLTHPTPSLAVKLRF